MMSDREQYTPGPARGAEVRKDGEKWTLILVRELRHSPEQVWQALTDPAQLREWAPFDVDGSLDTAGTTVSLTWLGAPRAIATRVTREVGNIHRNAVDAAREPLHGTHRRCDPVAIEPLDEGISQEIESRRSPA
jgi:hypothetical protein